MISLMNFEYKKRLFAFNPQEALDISLPLKNGKNNVNCYFADEVSFDTIRMGSFVGSVAEGGPCNYQKISLSPHGNGTHTECFGHISSESSANLYACLKRYLFFAQLVSLPIRQVNAQSIILWEDLSERIDADFIPEALIIRTLPNDLDKKTRQYSGTNPPFLDSKIGHYLAQKGILHLLVDLPSVDPEVDGGLLETHRYFWQYPDNIRSEATISELIYVEAAIPDDFYVLNIQVTSLYTDASPSKPILYSLKRF
ncbi:MAG: cyclase family protein [Microscillaceae bacterium]|nr:cyclase family protein [Microscillaceae bacterium]